MWMLEQLLHNKNNFSTAQEGEVNGTGVQTANSYAGMEQCSPWGIRWNAPQGAHAVVMNTDKGAVCMGCTVSGADLQPGELMLTSKGGASIYLKANGEVVINGQTFAAGKEG